MGRCQPNLPLGGDRWSVGCGPDLGHERLKHQPAESAFISSALSAIDHQQRLALLSKLRSLAARRNGNITNHNNTRSQLCITIRY